MLNSEWAMAQRQPSLETNMQHSQRGPQHTQLSLTTLQVQREDNSEQYRARSQRQNFSCFKSIACYDVFRWRLCQLQFTDCNQKGGECVVIRRP